MIRACNLSKHFGELRAVDGLDVTIEQGEFFAFLGPNAAGKTTTIKMLTGLLRPTAGECFIGPYDVQREPEQAKSILSYVPDFPFLYDKLTAREFMHLIGDIFNVDRREVISRTGVLFEKFHLTEYYGELSENLSHGTRQRLVIASALLHDPQVIIIDEPMVGLDPMHARAVKDELKERSRNGATVFLSTHQLAIAEEMADRIGVISHGKLVALGTTEELMRHHASEMNLEKVFLSIIDAAERSGATRSGR